LYKIDKPAQFILIADSMGTYTEASNPWGTYKNQSSVFNLSTGAGSGIHLRHNGLANIVFADGHVAACDKAKIKEAALAELPSSTVIKVAEQNLNANGTPNVVQIN
jgi:prepilin-type processing-associated H-X9-DG protein